MLDVPEVWVAIFVFIAIFAIVFQDSFVTPALPVCTLSVDISSIIDLAGFKLTRKKHIRVFHRLSKISRYEAFHDRLLSFVGFLNSHIVRWLLGWFPFADMPFPGILPVDTVIYEDYL